MTFYPHAGFLQYDADLGWTQIPNKEVFFKHREFEVKVTSNSHGFRDDESEFSKPETMKRVVVLGDSQTWGWGVEHEEIFCEVAEKAMANTEFLNLGHTSYGTAQEYLLYKKLGIKFSPDYTVLAFYPNDIQENSAKGGKRPKFILEDGQPVLKKKPNPYSFDRKIKWVLQNHFYLYFFVDYKIALLKKSLKIGSGGRKQYGFKEYFRRNLSPETEKDWKITEALLVNLDQLANHRLLIMYVPDRLQVEEDTYQEALIASKEEESAIDIFHPNKLLEEFSKNHGIPFLDLTPILRKEYGNGLPIFFDTDLHLTKDGHRIAGNELMNTMQVLLSPRSTHAFLVHPPK